MNFFIFILVGLVSGWLASVFVKGHGLGVVGDIVVGIVGAFVGGVLYNSMGVDSYGLWGITGMSFIGAVAFLLVVGLFTNPRQLGKHGH